MSDFVPEVAEILPAPAVADVFRCWAALPHCLFLDSALAAGELGRYSFLAADPVAFLESSDNQADPLGRLGEALAPYAAATVPGLPPFQGGAAGLLAYDLGRSLERLPPSRFDEFHVPALAVGLYDVVLAFDHVEQRAWLISQGLPEQQPAARRRRARERLAEFRTRLANFANNPETAWSGERWLAARGPVDRLSAGDLAPQFAVPHAAGVTSNFSAAGYLEAIERALEYIRAGDIFQVNLAQRLLCPTLSDPVALYLRLRQRNPAPFAGFFDGGRFQLASASPERFLQVRERQVEARPIKGTRRRNASPEADLFAGDDLRQSEKDRAENVMIVDLMRNDLSRVCRPESVRVEQLCRLEVYAFVQHLVSVVRGELAAGAAPLDLVRAAFPGGSITGAPKVRAMEIIAELEPTARGAYCGGLGYFGCNGALDLNILIRTFTVARGWWQFPVGGGIVAQSEAPREYEETWHKAEGLLRALAPEGS